MSWRYILLPLAAIVGIILIFWPIPVPVRHLIPVANTPVTTAPQLAPSPTPSDEPVQVPPEQPADVPPPLPATPLPPPTPLPEVKPVETDAPPAREATPLQATNQATNEERPPPRQELAQTPKPTDIGAVLTPHVDGARIVSVKQGSLADDAGLAEQDVITEIDGESLANKPFSETIDKLRLMEKPEVDLTVSRARGTTQRLTVRSERTQQRPNEQSGER